MLGAIIGDMAGSIYEFDNIKSRDFEFLSERCEPTDDSILTCAIARALIDVKGRGTQLERVTMFRMKEYFLANPLPMGGFGAKFFQWALSDVTEPYGSWGNGAAMRISPVAYVANSEMEVKLLSQIVTGTTHNDPEGLKGGRSDGVSRVQSVAWSYERGYPKDGKILLPWRVQRGRAA